MNQIVPFQILPALACLVAGYLLGNIQTAIIVSEAYYHDDIRKHGSGNAGSTNMVRVFGIKPGVVTFIGDFLKAVAGVLVGRLLMGTYGGYIAGFMVVVGHCYPVFVKFKGGKGVASSCGLGFMVNPIGAACAFTIAVIVFIITKKVSIMSLLGLLLFFISVLVFKGNDTALIILSGLMVLLIYIRHTENIKRLLHHNEPKLIPKTKD